MSLFYLIVIVAVPLFVAVGIAIYFVRRGAKERRAKNPENIP